MQIAVRQPACAAGWAAPPREAQAFLRRVSECGDASHQRLERKTVFQKHLGRRVIPCLRQRGALRRLYAAATAKNGKYPMEKTQIARGHDAAHRPACGAGVSERQPNCRSTGSVRNPFVNPSVQHLLTKREHRLTGNTKVRSLLQILVRCSGCRHDNDTGRSSLCPRMKRCPTTPPARYRH